MFKDVLRKLREKNGMTQEQLADVLGVSAGTIGNYEQGQRLPKDDKMWIKISNYFHVSIDYLMDVDREVSDTSQTITTYKENSSLSSTAPIALKKVPVLGKVACGQPIFSPESADVYTAIDSDLKVDFALIATGDSMIDAGIADGDIVLIKEQPNVETGEIAAVSINDEVTLKRVYYYPSSNKLVLQPANPNYPPMIYLDAELNDIKIIGKAIMVQHIL